MAHIKKRKSKIRKCFDYPKRFVKYVGRIVKYVCRMVKLICVSPILLLKYLFKCVNRALCAMKKMLNLLAKVLKSFGGKLATFLFPDKKDMNIEGLYNLSLMVAIFFISLRFILIEGSDITELVKNGLCFVCIGLVILLVEYLGNKNIRRNV